jgi:membrane protease YdiL (CAAX protease family)
VGALGQAFRAPRWRALVALAAALALVAGDMLHFWWRGYLVRALPAIAALGILLALVHFDRGSLGLRLRPVQGWGYWVKAGLAIGGIVFAIIGLAVIVLRLGWDLDLLALPAYFSLDWYVSTLLDRLLGAPIVEELIYRLALLAPLLALAGRAVTIVVSGLVFAGLHVVYGTPGPDNLVAGFFLGWAYLKSESLAIPILLHAIGNAAVVAFNLGTYYLRS